MAGLTDLIRELGDENTEFQLLNSSILNKVEKRATNDCEITFCSGLDKMSSKKQAVIVWTTVDDLDSALKRLKVK